MPRLPASSWSLNVRRPPDCSSNLCPPKNFAIWLLGGLVWASSLLLSYVKGPKHPLKKSYRKYLRRTQVRWVIRRSSTHNIWKATKEYLNHRGTKIRVFRVCFRAPFPPTLFLSFFPPLSPSGPVHLSHHFSPLHPPLYPLLFWLPENSDLGTPLISVLFSVLQTYHYALSRPYFRLSARFPASPPARLTRKSCDPGNPLEPPEPQKIKSDSKSDFRGFPQGDGKVTPKVNFLGSKRSLLGSKRSLLGSLFESLLIIWGFGGF